jgi:hypothetical protein
MNIRYITIFLVLGMTAAIFLTHSHLSRISPLPIVGTPVAAQTPDPTLIQVKSVPATGDSDLDPWHHFEITVPQTNPPLDMHMAFLVDGKGTEVIDEQPQAWSQPIPFKYRLDSDDDSRVKTILEAQGLPIKKNLVTYHFAAGTEGGVSFDRTIRFQHEPGGNGESTGEGPNNRDNAIGQKIVFYSSIISDSSFRGNFEKGLTYDQWTRPGYAPKFPAGLVHHLSVYVMFTPHQGPPVKGNESIAREL